MKLVWAPFNAVFLPLWEGLKRLGMRTTGAASATELPLRWEVGSALAASAFAAALSNVRAPVFEAAAAGRTQPTPPRTPQPRRPPRPPYARAAQPLDVVKTRLQVAGASNVQASVRYAGAGAAAAAIWREEGARGFARGVAGRVLWVAPSTAIMFASFDNIMKRI